MKVLVAGATGATGSLLAEQLLQNGVHVSVIVRSTATLPDAIRQHENLTITEASLLDLSDAALAEQVAGCDAIASCLGHNLSFKGLFGPPYRLVTEATRRLCRAVKAQQPTVPVKFVLMNTTGNRNRDLNEPLSLGHRIVVGLIRTLLPPHADNEQAADFLRLEIGQHDPAIEWAAVRPDGLINEDTVSRYEIHASPTRDAIFDAGTTSRINVAHFMAALMTDDALWQQWKGQMPVIYNSEPTA